MEGQKEQRLDGIRGLNLTISIRKENKSYTDWGKKNIKMSLLTDDMRKT